MLLKCEICYEVIGSFDPDTIDLPIRAEIFDSKNPDRGEPPSPFAHQPGMEWLDLRCPICRKRPFLSQDSVMTPNGRFFIVDQRLERKGPPMFPVLEIYTDEELEEEWNKRLITRKQAKQDEKQWVCDCGAAYKHQSSLSRHKLKCEVAKQWPIQHQQ